MAKPSTTGSKLLSLVLRHQPELAQVILEPGGWVNVADLLTGLKMAGHALTREELEDIVANSDKKRFTLSEDRKMIRAAQGHSQPVDLGLESSLPPDELWHGTAAKNLEAIMAEGLKPGARQHVHLSRDRETALTVGKRHGVPVALLVNAAAMRADGISFWQADNGVWLTQHVSADYIRKV
ncbi:RNA 2'-phosphotransferase [Rhodobacter sp. 24-YEA-8]|uniref:RNA 2'-phosphotransferase n=1 Tax=Rhodobacter sp. 24-YEA-8 TaxID=1884310 RepID=UPI0008995624|nr:RNA 2'-phosphotransferase [Rhodobacter sp. 24-YEA-8]SEB67407.1 putative RNA 2'-phosphotransferase [Rhodobacter sp. 24-YEA-8]